MGHTKKKYLEPKTKKSQKAYKFQLSLAYLSSPSKTFRANEIHLFNPYS